MSCELAPNCRVGSTSWNKKTANWLGRYIYARTGGSLFITYSMSAFWHGFYPGYYMFFLSLPLLTACERLGRRKLSPRAEAVVGTSWYSPWGLTTILVTELAMVYFGAPFMLQSWDWSYRMLRSNYFAGHVLCGVFFVVVSMIPDPKIETKTKTRTKTKTKTK